MGWHYEVREPGMTDAEFFARGMREDFEFVATGTVGRTFYAAVRKPDGEVFAVVNLLDRKGDSYYNFGYKPMDESVGPVEHEAPRKVLEALTPLPPKPEGDERDMWEYARDWRRRAWKALEDREKQAAFRKGLKRGDTVAVYGKTYTLVGKVRRSWVGADKFGGRYRLPGKAMRPA